MFSFWAIFCPFSSLTTCKIKILTLKKTPGGIILQIFTINDNQMIYGSWDMKNERYNFLSFWTVFCPFTPYGPRKSKFLKYEKNTRRYYHFTIICIINDSQMYCSWDIECRHKFLSLWTISPFCPLRTRKIQILIKWGNCLEILSFYTCAP